MTFRYRNPSAADVELEGEWYFSSPGRASTTSSQGLLPSQWKPGDFPIGWPNVGTTAGWPIFRMKEDRHTGVWSYTIPLPSGEFNYGFAVNCLSEVAADPYSTGCPEISDPSNPSWNSIGSLEPTSQVYVPSDSTFHTVDYGWQAPTSPRGTLRDLTSPYLAGINDLAIYTPPGYAPRRSSPYPTLYLSAGYNSNEVDWSTRADAANILDNLIDKGKIGPMVVVMTRFKFNDCLGDDATAYDRDLVSLVRPYIESHYHVSKTPSQRAFAGLSCGGGMAASLLLHYTREFGYFGIFSPYPANIPPALARAIKHVGVMIGGGKQDPIHQNAVADLSSLRSAGVEVLTDFINGGHDWYVWRILLRDFLTRVAFRPVGG